MFHAVCKMFQGGRRLRAGKRLSSRACSATTSRRQGGTVALRPGNEHVRWTRSPSCPGTQLQPRRALSRLQLPDALGLPQTNLLQRAVSRMQYCTLPGPALFRSARHLTCSVLSGVVLRRLLSSGNIVNWDKKLWFYRKNEDPRTTPMRPRSRARKCACVVSLRPPRQPIRLGVVMLLRKRVST